MKTLLAALASPDLNARSAALLRASQRALRDGDDPLAHMLCARRAALIHGGPPALIGHLRALGRAAPQHPLARLTPLNPRPVTPSVWGHDGPIERLAAGGEQIVSLGQDRSLRAWDARGMLLGALRDVPADTLLAVSDGAILITLADTLMRWDAPAQPSPQTRAPAAITALLASHDLVVIACADDSLWRVAPDAATLEPLGHAPAAALAIRDRHLITLATDGGATLRPLDTPDAITQLAPPPRNDHDWEAHVALLEDGLIVLEQIQDRPGSIYGRTSTWCTLDPLTRERTYHRERPSSPPPRLASGAEVHADPSGAILLAPREHAPAGLARPILSASPESLIAAQGGHLLIFNPTSLERLNTSTKYQANISKISHHPEGSITLSKYQVQGARSPEAWVRDPLGEQRLVLGNITGYKAWIDASPDGTTLVSRFHNILTGYSRSLERMWSAKIAAQHVQSCGWSADGALIAVAISGLGVVRVAPADATPKVLSAALVNAQRYALSPDGAALLITNDHHGFIWMDATSGATLRQSSAGVMGGASCVAYDAHQALVGTALGAVERLDIKTGALRTIASGAWVRQIKLFDALALVVGDQGRAELLRAADGVAVQALIGHPGDVVACAWRDGDTFATADTEGVILCWERGVAAPTRAMRSHEGGIAALAWLPDGTILSGGDDGRIIAWREAEPDILSHMSGPITTLLASADGARLLVGGTWGHEVRDLATGESSALHASIRQPVMTADGAAIIAQASVWRLDLLDAASGATIAALDWTPRDGVPDQVWVVDREHVIVAWSGDGDLSCVALATGEDLWRVAGPLRHVAREAAGARLWAARGAEVLSINIADGAATSRWTHRAEVRALAADTRGAASVGADGMLIVFGEDGDPRALWAHEHALSSVALSADRVIVADEQSGWIGGFALE